jgi:hypothetical protein
MRGEIREGEKALRVSLEKRLFVEATEASWQKKQSAVASTMHRA